MRLSLPRPSLLLAVALVVTAAPSVSAQYFNTAEAQQALYDAVEAGDAATARAMLDAGIDVSVPEIWGAQPNAPMLLDLALGFDTASNRDLDPPDADLARAVLAAGAAPDASRWDKTPLHRAVTLAVQDAPTYLDAVSVLLEFGADPDARGLFMTIREFVGYNAENQDADAEERSASVRIQQMMRDARDATDTVERRRYDARLRALARQVRRVYAQQPTAFEALRSGEIRPGRFGSDLLTYVLGDGESVATWIETDNEPAFVAPLVLGAEARLQDFAREALAAIHSEMPGLVTDARAPGVLWECAPPPSGTGMTGRTVRVAVNPHENQHLALLIVTGYPEACES